MYVARQYHATIHYCTELRPVVHNRMPFPASSRERIFFTVYLGVFFSVLSFTQHYKVLQPRPGVKIEDPT